MSLKSYIKTTDDEKTITKKLDKFKENITEEDKKLYIERAVTNELTRAKSILAKYEGHELDEVSKDYKIELHERVVIYQKILEDFEERGN